MSRIIRSLSQFVVFTGEDEGKLHHIEVVELYKQRILSLEIELELVRNERNRYEQMWLQQMGITHNNEETIRITQEPITRPMSLSRMRHSLEAASRKRNDKKSVG